MKKTVKQLPKYSDQLIDKRWIRKRYTILKRDKYSCTECHIQDSILHVHHLYYIQGSLAWQYPNKALITLCEKCHERWHELNVLEVREATWNKNKDYTPKRKKNKKTKVIWTIRKLKLKKLSLADLQVKDRYRKKTINGEWQVV